VGRPKQSQQMKQESTARNQQALQHPSRLVLQATGKLGGSTKLGGGAKAAAKLAGAKAGGGKAGGGKAGGGKGAGAKSSVRPGSRTGTKGGA